MKVGCKTHSVAVLAACAGLMMLASACSTTPGMAVDDAVLTTKVKTQLVENPATKARQIDVDTHNGIVQLNGFVDTAEAKTEAAAVARKVAGVKSVDNNLQVRTGERSVGTVIDDAALTAKVKTALIGDSRTKAYEIEVKSYKGVVALGGFVGTQAERAAAQQVAEGVSGVDKVDNGIQVRKVAE